MRGNDGHVYVAIGQLCDLLGMGRASQTRRIRSDEILADGYQGSVNLTYPGGGTRPSGVLRVDLLPLWLTAFVRKRFGRRFAKSSNASNARLPRFSGKHSRKAA